jgi:hypothetical protein
MKKSASLLLVLALTMTLSACGTQSAAPAASASPSPSAAEYPQLEASKTAVSADLNGDGKADEIYLDTANADPDGQPKITALKINGTDYTASLYDGTGFYSDNPDESHWALTDVDASDGMLEIAIMDFGPSDDDVTGFFRYDGKSVTYLGSVSGLAFAQQADGSCVPGDLSFDGAGTVGAYLRLSVLQTWFAACDYRLGSDGKFAPVPQALYYPLKNQTYPVKALQDLTVYAENDLGSAASTLAAGGTLTVIATDNARWVLCRNASGADCWLHLSEDGQQIDTPSGAVYSGQALDGLVFAD